MTKLFFFLFLAFVCVGFSEEILQGTLQNGMHYYLWPDREEKWVSISLIAKKPERWEFLSLSKGSKEHSFSNIKESFCSVSIENKYINEEDFKETLEGLQIDRILSEVPFLKDEYFAEENGDDFPDRAALKLTNLLFGCNLARERFLFDQDVNEINKAFKELLHPSRMALVITGSFPPLAVEELETLFGSMPDEKGSPPLSLKLTEPLAVHSYCSDLDLYPSGLYRYYYRFEPTFKHFVLNDLFLVMGINGAGFQGPVSELLPLGYLSAFWPISFCQKNETLFTLAKSLLKGVYEEEIDKEESCQRHFLSGISAKLEPDNQYLLRELELATLDDFNLFLEQNIGDLFSCPILELSQE